MEDHPGLRCGWVLCAFGMASELFQNSKYIYEGEKFVVKFSLKKSTRGFIFKQSFSIN